MGVTKHGEAKDDNWSKEYKAWWNMQSRCAPSNPKRKHYFDRGIKVCARWLGDGGYQNFLSDVGRAPSPRHSLDRYPDGNGDYEPGNVRWATRIEQARNMQSNVVIEYAGEKRTLAEWAESAGINYDSLLSRLNFLGWTFEMAISTPVQTKVKDLQ